MFEKWFRKETKPNQKPPGNHMSRRDFLKNGGAAIGATLAIGAMTKVVADYSLDQFAGLKKLPTEKAIPYIKKELGSKGWIRSWLDKDTMSQVQLEDFFSVLKKIGDDLKIAHEEPIGTHPALEKYLLRSEYSVPGMAVITAPAEKNVEKKEWNCNASFIEHGGDTFLVTAAHCVNGTDDRDAFIDPPGAAQGADEYVFLPLNPADVPASRLHSNPDQSKNTEEGVIMAMTGVKDGKFDAVYGMSVSISRRQLQLLGARFQSKSSKVIEQWALRERVILCSGNYAKQSPTGEMNAQGRSGSRVVAFDEELNSYDPVGTFSAVISLLQNDRFQDDALLVVPDAARFRTSLEAVRRMAPPPEERKSLGEISSIKVQLVNPGGKLSSL